MVILGVVPRWSPYEDQSGIGGWTRSGGPVLQFVFEDGRWSENKDDLLGTVLRGIFGCEDDVDRKENSPRWG